ncbi:MAG: cytochrome c [Desulfatiglandaceae bacterium]
MAGYWRGLIPAVGILCLLLVLWGPNGQGAQTASKFQLPQIPKSALTPAEQKGRALYEYYCTLCHGKTGKGDGINSYNLSKPPRNFTDRARMAAISDSQIQKVIKEGGTVMSLSPLMPAWGGVLTVGEASDLTAFIRTLAKQDGGKK